jgi:hypothetical protein
MQDRYPQLQFIAANYSKLQGLREVPVGSFVTLVALWTMNHQGDLGLPLLFLLGTTLLYWLVDRYYTNTFGHIRQTPETRFWELMISVLFSVLALLAFSLDTAKDLPVSIFGLVFAAALFEDFWRATRSVRAKEFHLYPENFIAACLIFLLSLLPLSGLAWWQLLGWQSQTFGILAIIGILLILAGLWGHIRIVRVLSVGEAKSDANTL